MGVEKLDALLRPRSIAVVGASNRPGSVGWKLLRNLIGVGYRGTVFPVNPYERSIQGIQAYPSVLRIPHSIDLAIIATPSHVVPDIIDECGQAAVRAAIVVSAEPRDTCAERPRLEDQIRERNRYGIRILGPNCLGVMRPRLNLNATFASKMPRPGDIAFISQSGAISISVLEWASSANVGFSSFVSVGSMMDIDFGDLIDYFGADPETKSIMLYLESIAHARKFMSAARGFARSKPIIVVKSGRFEENAKITEARTRIPVVEDAIYDAAFKRAGMIRVNEIEDLFYCAEALSKQPRPLGARLAIVTNGCGPAIMASDALVMKGGRLASLSPNSVRMLDVALGNWSGRNPVDLLDDATPEDYRTAIQVCLKDPRVDGLLVIYTPECAADPVETANIVAELSKGQMKPILACWMGTGQVEAALKVLHAHGVPTYPTPEHAVNTYMHMYQYTRNLELLYETPEELPLATSVPKEKLRGILERVISESREKLTQVEVATFLSAYGITRSTQASSCPNLEPETTEKLSAEGAKVFLLRVSASRNPIFGSVIQIGLSYPCLEACGDRAFGFPPLDQILARRLIEQTNIWKLLRGHGGAPSMSCKLLEEALVRFSQLVVDFPEFQEIVIDPLLVDQTRVVALDSKALIQKEALSEKAETYSHLIISPYPRKYVSKLALKDGRSVTLRPIKPEDEPLVLGLFRSFSPETMRQRFFYVIKEIPHEMLVKYCNIDYDREATIVAETVDPEGRKIVGMAGLVVEPDGVSAEMSAVVTDSWQGLGLGSGLFDKILEIAKDMGVRRVYGIVQPENYRVIRLCEKKGFRIDRCDPSECLVTFKIEREKEVRGEKEELYWISGT